MQLQKALFSGSLRPAQDALFPSRATDDDSQHDTFSAIKNFEDRRNRKCQV